MRFPHRTTVLAALLALALSAPALRAEEPKPAPEPTPSPQQIESAVFTLKNADVREVADVLGSFRQVLGGSVRANTELRTIAVSGTKELVAACTEAIRKLDVPPVPSKNIELTFYILVASKTPLPGGECPAAVQRFCDQMKEVFKGFRLLETVSLRTREGSRAQSSGIIAPSAPGGDSMPYELRFDSVQVMADEQGQKNLIRINKLSFDARVTERRGSGGAETASAQNTGLTASVDFREGQDVGISTSSRGNPGEALCVVVQAKIVG